MDRALREGGGVGFCAGVVQMMIGRGKTKFLAMVMRKPKENDEQKAED
jgi:hypothetical protein